MHIILDSYDLFNIVIFWFMLWIIKLDIMADLYIGGTSAGFLVILFEYALLEPSSCSFIGHQNYTSNINIKMNNGARWTLVIKTDVVNDAG